MEELRAIWQSYPQLVGNLRAEKSWEQLTLLHQSPKPSEEFADWNDDRAGMPRSCGFRAFERTYLVPFLCVTTKDKLPYHLVKTILKYLIAVGDLKKSAFKVLTWVWKYRHDFPLEVMSFLTHTASLTKNIRKFVARLPFPREEVEEFAFLLKVQDHQTLDFPALAEIFRTNKQ
jgi:hypothetical protein